MCVCLMLLPWPQATARLLKGGWNLIPIWKRLGSAAALASRVRLHQSVLMWWAQALGFLLDLWQLSWCMHRIVCGVSGRYIGLVDVFFLHQQTCHVPRRHQRRYLRRARLCVLTLRWVCSLSSRLSDWFFRQMVLIFYAKTPVTRKSI